MDRIRTKNIYDNSRFIYLFHCTTHGDKSMRNQLFGSWSGGKGKKTFLTADGDKISKSILDECYKRDQNQASRLTRLTACRGFFEYCRAVIKFAEENECTIPKFHGISVAHSNTSVLEAWFSLVRNMRLDSATSYGSAVGNKEMRNACSLISN